jgi:hypothetical protein
MGAAVTCAKDAAGAAFCAITAGLKDTARAPKAEASFRVGFMFASSNIMRGPENVTSPYPKRRSLEKKFRRNSVRCTPSGLAKFRPLCDLSGGFRCVAAP